MKILFLDIAGKNNGMYGRHHKEETKKKIGSKAKLRPGSMLGKKHKESSKRKISKKLEKYKGINHSRYIPLHYDFLIREYFKLESIKNIIIKYNIMFQVCLSLGKYRQFLKILNFPTNTMHSSNKKQKKEYLLFIENNKNKIEYFINNYKIFEISFFEEKNNAS
jgi:hypothetical protein